MRVEREKRLEGAPKERGREDLVRELLEEHRTALPGKRTLIEQQLAEELDASAGAQPEAGRGISLPALDGFRTRGLDEVLTVLASMRSGRALMAATLAAARRNAGPPRVSLTVRPAPPDPTGHAMWRAAERRAATLYRRAIDSGEVRTEEPAVEAALARAGGGQPLPAAVRRAMERELGASLERVRIHTDAVAADAARAVRARAFTVGEDIFFAEGAYAPETPGGARLLAHELTHAVQAQQGRAPVAEAGIRVSAPDEPAEREAEGVADRIGDPRAPEAVLTELGSGRPLDSGAASRLGAAMEDDFGDVRIHTDAAAARKAAELDARAFTVGSHVAFAAGEYLPGTPEGDALLAHELAHVQQQRAAAQAPVRKRRDEPAPDEAHEADADSAAAGVLSRLYSAGAGLVRVARGVARAAVERTRATVASGYALQRCPSKGGKEDAGVKDAAGKEKAKEDTPLVAEIKKALAGKDLAGVFRKLRDSHPTPEEQQEIKKALEAAAPSFSDDDLWLAKHLLAGNAADPNAAPTDDARMFTDPDPDPGTKSPIQTEVHFVAGRSNRRALVIGGVHGSEPEGEVVVRQLIEALKKAKTKPFFTVVLVPRLIDRSRQDPSPKSHNDPYREVDDKTAKGSADDTSKGTGSEGNIEVEPNRNFPLPGTSYDSYKKKGYLEFWDARTKKVRAPKDIVKTDGKKENRVKAVASEKMLPENRLLVHLIERFQPERLVSVHQHGVPGRRGDGPGVFVDPRRPAAKRSADDGFDRATDQALTPEGQQDDKLAVAMRDSIQKGAETDGLRKADTDPLAGNAVPLPGDKGNDKGKKSPTAHYKTAAHAEGNSLGDYAPVEVNEGGAWDRPAIGTITIEIPQYDKTKKDQAADLAKLEAIEVATLQSIFLEDPAKVTP